jgi:endonuclease/exonuclease/phosphatase family metal-dependent hydrolase
MKKRMFCIFALLLSVISCFASIQDEVRIATYNIEHFMKLFDQHNMPARSRDRTEMFRDEKEIYAIARTMQLPEFNADIVVIQECCDRQMLEYFNKRWLDGKYGFVKVFAGNTDGQYLGVLGDKELEILDIRQYYQDRDPVDDSAVRRFKEDAEGNTTNRLFCRGPGFVLFQTKNGTKFWVGNTHIKSKSGNSHPVTKWRVRQIERIREICFELLAEAHTDKLIMLGDFNDDVGMDRFEESLGIDAVTQMKIEQDGIKLISPTFNMFRENNSLATYHCKIKPPTYRSFIDHIFVSPKMYEFHTKTIKINAPIAEVASDHFPLVSYFEFAGTEE